MENTPFEHQKDGSKSLPHKFQNGLLSKLLRALVGHSEFAASKEVQELSERLGKLEDLIDVLARQLKIQADKAQPGQRS